MRIFQKHVLPLFVLILYERRSTEGNCDKTFTYDAQPYFRGENTLEAKLLVDGEEIDLNEFVTKVLSGMAVGAVTSLRGIKKDWKKIEIKVTK